MEIWAFNIHNRYSLNCFSMSCGLRQCCHTENVWWKLVTTLPPWRHYSYFHNNNNMMMVVIVIIIIIIIIFYYYYYYYNNLFIYECSIINIRTYC
jgi:hypothetical protein